MEPPTPQQVQRARAELLAARQTIDASNDVLAAAGLSIDLSHTSAILDLKRGSVGYKVVKTQPWIWVTVVFPEGKSIYRGIHLTLFEF